MMLAELNLEGQSQHLYTIVLAILQPLFFIALVFGFVLASAHLLTMLGTRWGDRRASPKALFFSVAIHILFGVGIICMIPEYRQRVFASLSELQEIKIEIKSPELDPGEQELAHIQNGQVPVWDRLPQVERTDVERFQASTQSASPDQMVLPDTIPTPFVPTPVLDTARLPEADTPSPERTQANETGQRTSPTQDFASVNPLPVEARPEPVPSATENRSTLTSTEIAPPEQIQPRPGMVEKVVPEFNIDPAARPFPLDSDPTANVQQAPEGLAMERRTGPAPANPVEDFAGREETGLPNPAMLSSPVSPNLVRTPLRNPSTTPLTSEQDVVPRPLSPTTIPDSVLPRPDLAMSRVDQIPDPNPVAPELRRQDGDSIMRRNELPLAYQLRGETQRRRAVMEYGGSAESEEAVDRSLQWLASVQHPDGYWDAEALEAGKLDIGPDGQKRYFAGRNADAGITGLAILAFLGKQNTVSEGQYSENVRRGLRWLVSQQRTFRWDEFTNRSELSKWTEDDIVDEGYLGGKANKFCGMYCHAMATFALGEAYAVSRSDPNAQWLREPLEKAVGFILTAQLQDGGWRYLKGEGAGDVSVLGWQIMALKSAELGGIRIPVSTRQRIITFLKSNASGVNGGLASYRVDERVSPTMTAEALFCRQVLGLTQQESSQTSEEAANYLLFNRPKRTELNYYYWYYGTLAMYQHGGPAWEEWNNSTRDLIISEQVTEGPLAGSWAPRDTWGGYGGRVYSTAVATLCLEVYYRYQSAHNLKEESQTP
ncbi:MAG: hypothetical protein KDA88_10445 [Planctomycetaceae bacterium]|nr:hypothetical protein [Planctomycetaceae bacterium]MCB9950340.1 hypothetical protein [Planctomycetaceae bacterium]